MSITPTQRKLIVILGPTASGKSDLAADIAETLGGEIISADSRQVYRGMDIGTGKIPRHKPTNHKTNKSKNYLYRGIPHYLLDVTSPKHRFSVAQFQNLARKALEGIWKRGKLPIICGGTGFYIQAVVDGLILPDVKPNPLLRTKLSKKTADELFVMLRKKDRARAKTIDQKNRARLIRALEIAEALGAVPKLKIHPLHADILMLGTAKKRAELQKLIARRLLRRIDEGMIEEVARLHAGGVSWKKLESFGLEYKYCALLLQNKISREVFLRELEHAILQYAKRQMTWFRRDARIRWVRNPREALRLARQFVK